MSSRCLFSAQKGIRFRKSFVDEVRQILTEKQAQNKLPYDLKISVGSDSLKDRNDKLEACLVRADEKLYEDKKKRNIGR